MSNQAIVDILHFDDEVLVLAEDNYGKKFVSYSLESFKLFEDVQEVLDLVSSEAEMAGSFWVDMEGDREVVLEVCNSVEVHGFYPPGHEKEGEVFVFTREDNE